MHSNINRVKEEAGKAAGAVAEASRHIGSAAHCAGDAIQDTVRGVRENVREAARHVAGAVEEKIESGAQRTRDALERGCAQAQTIEHHFENAVRAMPLRSLVIAVGVGLTLGLATGVLLRRR
jgi:ElaB/YqjD/DUF883 family membrane-anchored ribosome-binding protein